MEKHQLQNYQARLVELRDRLIHEVNSAEEALREDINSPGTVTHLPTHPADNDATGLDEQLAIVANEEQLLEEVDAALARIDAGTFGVCEDCGKPIDPARLEAIPYVSRCIACAKRHEQESPA
jgi:DnaK suppressor protein